MITIAEYLQNVYEDLQKYVENNVCLCKLKKLTFEAGGLPDYTDKNIQQLYLLRYTFDYAFEYSRMYRRVLEQMDDVSQIAVTSIGCGNMVDYWGLLHALEEKGGTDSRVRYIGIDKIDWNYKFPVRPQDEVHYWVADAKDFLANNTHLFSDVYFFPKSLSEFSDMDLNAIVNGFSSKKIQKNKFFVFISLREDSGSMEMDLQRSKRLIEAITENGFCTEWSYDKYIHFNGNDGITSVDNTMRYPSEALDLVTNLHTKCAKYKVQGENCQPDCQKYLSRYPILRVNHIRYQVIMFERVK